MAYDVLIAIAGTAFIGLLVGYLFGRSRRPAAEREAARLQEQLDDYKARVQEHFEQTSDLVQNLTQDYKKVYDHLAAGAVGLCDANEVKAPPRLHWESDEASVEKSRVTPTLGSTVVSEAPADGMSVDAVPKNDPAALATRLAEESSISAESNADEAKPA